MLKLLNWVFGWFGYEWVPDTRPYEREYGENELDDGWDDLYETNPRYHLRRKGASSPDDSNG
ncbi:hypothetical protein AVO42_01500 [Thiomicrospira sp. XS5]|uniref:hypothetical protein n=1 Tax=Thiomicrospira sp. XS5 TaxID=1775636 RepID=UPI000747C740|nr:hypothetical protein [Thiomicrospira sp. XS5]KUJ74119.1 hypothetical protein AVO42_01500 [Thiomicrospira sp. XS5]